MAKAGGAEPGQGAGRQRIAITIAAARIRSHGAAALRVPIRDRAYAHCDNEQANCKKSLRARHFEHVHTPLRRARLILPQQPSKKWLLTRAPPLFLSSGTVRGISEWSTRAWLRPEPTQG